MTKDEALNMSIELMERFLDYDGISSSDYIDVLDACKEALEPEPMTTTDVITCKMVGKCCMTGEALEQPTVAELNDEYLRDTYVVGLNQPAQKPVAWMHRHAGEITEFNDFQSCQYCEPLYTHPHQWQGNKEFVGLTDSDVQAMWEFYDGKYYDFYTAIEQALKDKNK